MSSYGTSSDQTHLIISTCRLKEILKWQPAFPREEQHSVTTKKDLLYIASEEALTFGFYVPLFTFHSVYQYSASYGAFTRATSLNNEHNQRTKLKLYLLSKIFLVSLK